MSSKRGLTKYFYPELLPSKHKYINSKDIDSLHAKSLQLVNYLGLKLNKEEINNICELLKDVDTGFEPYTPEQLYNLKKLINLDTNNILTAEDFIKHCKNNCPLINSLFPALAKSTDSKKIYPRTKKVFFEEMKQKKNRCCRLFKRHI